MVLDIYSYAPEWRSLVDSKKQNYTDIRDDYSNFRIVVHNATWCPDCVRETTELLAFVEVLGAKAPSLEIIPYEDINDYKEKKLSGVLEITCLPTIIFSNNDGELGRIEEKSDPDFKSLALKALSKQ